MSLKNFISLSYIFFGLTHICWASFMNIEYAVTCGQYEKYEISFNLPDYHNNYDPEVIDVFAEFTSPSGELFKVNAFYFENFIKTDNGLALSCENLVATNQKHWLIRFTPNMSGNWSFTLKLRENMNSEIIQHPLEGVLSFFCFETNNPGFVQTKDTRYLQRSDGSSFIPIGNSLPWFERTPWRGTCEYGTNQMRQIIDLMSANNMSFFRFEVNFFESVSLIGYDFTLQKNFCKYYNQKAAWQMDKILEYAEYNDIFILLALFAHGQLGNDGVISQYHAPNGEILNFDFFNSQNEFIDGYAHGAWSLFHPYNEFLSVNNLPQPPDSNLDLQSPYEFYSSSFARQEQKKLIRYIIARWGYSTHLMGYELMDEADRIDVKNRNDLHPNFIPPPNNLNQSIVDWHQDLTHFIQEHNTQKHLLTTAYADINHPTVNQVFALMDFTQIHDYTNYLVAPWNSVQETYLSYISDYLSRFNKPAMIGEHNYILYPDIDNLDPNLYNLKDNLWATLHNGSFAPASYWTQFHVKERNATSIYYGIGKYVKSIELSEDFKPVERIDEHFRSYYLHDNSEDKFYGWIQDNNFTYRNLLTNHMEYLHTFFSDDRPSISSKLIEMDFHVSRNGRYELRWFDTNSGDHISTQTIFSSQNKLHIQMPQSLQHTKHGDAAFQIEYINNELDFEVVVFPNPSNSGLYEIRVSDNISINSLEIFTINGTKVREVNLGTYSNLNIDLSNESSGLYLLNIIFGGSIQRTIKLLKI